MSTTTTTPPAPPATRGDTHPTVADIVDEDQLRDIILRHEAEADAARACLRALIRRRLREERRGA